MAIDKNLLLVLKSSGIGEGEPDLGEKLLASFLTTLLESGTVPARIICMSRRVFCPHSAALLFVSGPQNRQRPHIWPKSPKTGNRFHFF